MKNAISKSLSGPLFFISLVLLFFAISCAPYSDITGSWTTSRHPDKTYKSLLVMSLTPHAVPKSILENDLAEQFEKNGLRAFKSIDLFPPSFGKDTINKDQLKGVVKEKNIDALFTVSLIKKETDSHYVPGDCVYAPMMFGYYGNFWGYYSYWYPCVYSSGYYVTTEIYYLEFNLYDAESDKMVWSAQSQTYDPDKLAFFSKELASLIVRRMKHDGIIKPAGIALK
jgi:hypothetical protein